MKITVPDKNTAVIADDQPSISCSYGVKHCIGLDLSSFILAKTIS